MWKLTKQYFKNLWVNLWSKTTIDEKAMETMAEIQKRYKLTAAELKDVAKAIKEFGNQIGDIGTKYLGLGISSLIKLTYLELRLNLELYNIK